MNEPTKTTTDAPLHGIVPPLWMSIEELDAVCDWQPAPELTAVFRQAAERADSEQANRERLRDAQATAEFLRQPVIYSQR